MKNITGLLLAVLLVFSTTMHAAATETAAPIETTEPSGCILAAESVEGTQGDVVTVPITITSNPGFTNYAIWLDYDSEYLTIKNITMDGGIGYLWDNGRTVSSVNCQGEKSSGEKGACVVLAAAEAVKEDGILFTATFEIVSDFTGTAQVMPVVQYLRCQEEESSAFKQIQVSARAGTVTVAKNDAGGEGGDTGQPSGDVNGDGICEYDDVMLTYKALLHETEFTEEQIQEVDFNRNGVLDESDLDMLYDYYFGG